MRILPGSSCGGKLGLFPRLLHTEPSVFGCRSEAANSVSFCLIGCLLFSTSQSQTAGVKEPQQTVPTSGEKKGPARSEELPKGKRLGWQASPLTLAAPRPIEGHGENASTLLLATKRRRAVFKLRTLRNKESPRLKWSTHWFSCLFFHVGSLSRNHWEDWFQSFGRFHRLGHIHPASSGCPGPAGIKLQGN